MAPNSGMCPVSYKVRQKRVSSGVLPVSRKTSSPTIPARGRDVDNHRFTKTILSIVLYWNNDHYTNKAAESAAEK